MENKKSLLDQLQKDNICVILKASDSFNIINYFSPQIYFAYQSHEESEDKY